MKRFFGIGPLDGVIEEQANDIFSVNTPSFWFFIPPVFKWSDIFDGETVSFNLNPLGAATQVQIWRREELIAQFPLQEESFFHVAEDEIV